VSWATAIVIIVALSVLGKIWKDRQNTPRDHIMDQHGNRIEPSPREREMESELEELRERVKVLERIATDGNEAQRLSSEIDRLRDE